MSQQCYEIVHPSYCSKAVMRLHFQILLKLPILTLLAGPAPAASHVRFQQFRVI